MDPSHITAYVNFSCELRIIQARNIEFIKSTKNLFARLYLPTGNDKRIQLNSKSVSTKSVPFWGESFNLDCSCPQEFLENLNQQSLVLELRQRKIWGSQLIGKGDIPWKVILEAQNMELKKWLKMDLVSGSECKEGMFSTPEVEVEIKIRVASVVEMEKQNKRRLNNWNECGCKNGHDHQAWCSAEECDIFAFGAALEAF
uniref:C2 domain-containing protein n=1 Tax=Medicago truncatula TaxID=3880 RepID=I3SLZ5_MEDTR|nr:unknown [Medicago truncatula]